MARKSSIHRVLIYQYIVLYLFFFPSIFLLFNIFFYFKARLFFVHIYKILFFFLYWLVIFLYLYFLFRCYFMTIFKILLYLESRLLHRKRLQVPGIVFWAFICDWFFHFYTDDDTVYYIYNIYFKTVLSYYNLFFTYFDKYFNNNNFFLYFKLNLPLEYQLN